MTITYPLTLPSNFDSIQLTAQNVQGRNTNLYTNKEQVYSYSGDRWTLNVTYPRKALVDARLIQAFLLALRGGVGTFIAGDPYQAAPSGIATGTPVINGAGQTGYTLATTGWTAGQTGILKAGDYIQIGSYNLHMVLQDANSNGSGQATFDIWPRIRTSPSNGSAVVINSPKCLFRLTDSNVGWAVDKESLYDFSLSAVEAI